MVCFARDTMRWLGIWLDLALTLQENQRCCINRARRAEARVQRITTKNGVPPASARNLQMAIAQGTLPYAAELTWNGRRGVEGKHQQQ